MHFSLEPFESLPIIKKLPFSGKEKRLLGLILLLSSSFFLFGLTAYLILYFTTPKEIEYEATKTEHSQSAHEPTKEKKGEKETSNKEYDDLEKEALILAAAAYLRAGLPEKAGEFIEKLAETKNQSARLRRLTANILIEQERIDEARPYLELLRREEPKNSETAQLYVRTIPTATLISKPIDSIVPGFSKNSDVLYAAAKTVEEHAPEEAAAFLIESLNSNPKNHRALFLLGTLYLENPALKDIEKAQIMLQRAVNVAPDSAEYIGALGVAEFEKLEEAPAEDKKLFIQCEQSLKKAVQLKPSSTALLYNLAELYSTSEDHFLKAEDLYLKVLKISPSFWNASFKLGLLYLENKKYTGAIDQFHKALSYSSDNIRILHQLAVAFEKSGDLESSQNIYKQIVTIDPKDNIALYKLKIIK